VSRILADRERCVGSGSCELLAPELFEVGDDGVVQVLRSDPAGDDAAARDAASACPTGALSIDD